MNRLLLSALLVTIVSVAKAQIPQQLNYQGIARTSSGLPITYQTIRVRISLVDSASSGLTAYSETRTVRTNYVGLFNIVIGSPGAASSTGSMQDVNWITGRKYIKLEIDPTASGSFALAGITQLQSVPYALSAGSAALTGNAHGDLTGTYPGPTIANGAITADKLAEGSVKLSKLEPAVAQSLANKVNASDTSAMLFPYAKKSDLGVSDDSKLNTLDTAAMLTGYKTGIADLAVNKLSASDTAAMLLPYQAGMAELTVNKLSASDTAAMLSPYQAGMADLAVNKLSASDTAAMLLPYQAEIAELAVNKLSASDTAAMLLPYAMKTDVAAQIAAAAPAFTTGTAGTDFNVTSTGNLFTLNLPDASDTARGLVTFNDQTFYGAKSFTSSVMVNGIMIGKGLGQNDHNVAIGIDALGTGTGTRNTAVGYGAMRSYSGNSFDNSSSFGYFNMANLTTGEANTSVGAEAMIYLTTGRRNTAIGQQSLINNTGDENTALGSGAGYTIEQGYRNTFIGTVANASFSNLENATALGYEALVDASNKIQLGNLSVTSVSTSGKLTTGAITYPNTDGAAGQVLTTDGSGSATWTSASSKEAADEFDADPGQLEFILTETPSANSKVKMYINGIRISNKAYSVSGNILSYDALKNGSYVLTATDRIQFDYSY